MSRVGYRLLGIFFVLLFCVHWKSRSQEDTTVDHAALRGLGTPFRGSVGGLPRSRLEGCLPPHNAVAGCPTPGLRLFRCPVKAEGARVRTFHGLGLGRQGALLGHGPPKRTQCPGAGGP
jgi:hypothetical protein